MMPMKQFYSIPLKCAHILANQVALAYGMWEPLLRGCGESGKRLRSALSGGKVAGARWEAYHSNTVHVSFPGSLISREDNGSRFGGVMVFHSTKYAEEYGVPPYGAMRRAFPSITPVRSG
jgi:hypothetical protein